MHLCGYKSASAQNWMSDGIDRRVDTVFRQRPDQPLRNVAVRPVVFGTTVAGISGSAHGVDADASVGRQRVRRLREHQITELRFFCFVTINRTTL